MKPKIAAFLTFSGLTLIFAVIFVLAYCTSDTRPMWLIDMASSLWAAHCITAFTLTFMSDIDPLWRPRYCLFTDKPLLALFRVTSTLVLFALAIGITVTSGLRPAWAIWIWVITRAINLARYTSFRQDGREILPHN